MHESFSGRQKVGSFDLTIAKLHCLARCSTSFPLESVCLENQPLMWALRSPSRIVGLVGCDS